MLSNLSPEHRPPEPAPLRVVKPLTVEQEYLRPDLRANLLAALAFNRKHEDGGIRLYELGRVYLPRQNDLPAEPDMLCGIMSGPRTVRSWLGADGALDFYDVKGVVERLFAALGIDIGFQNSHDEGLHPARQAAITFDKDGQSTGIGVLGELHPKVADAFEIAGPVGLFEINVTGLVPLAGTYKVFQAIPRFPSIVRDIALVVDAGVTNKQILDVIKGFSLVSEVVLFDVYSGKQVTAGKKSLAYRLVYQSPDHTLTDEEVGKVQAQILAKLAKAMGATLRA
jgi:phenylalanyl-tRNA synthetase beta chain